MAHALTLDTILSSSWGYDQTNVDFYQVVGVTGSFVTLMRIASEDVTGDGWTGKRMPVKNTFLPNAPLRRKVKDYGNGPYVSIESFASARVWNGKPESYSSYA